MDRPRKIRYKGRVYTISKKAGIGDLLRKVKDKAIEKLTGPKKEKDTIAEEYEALPATQRATFDDLSHYKQERKKIQDDYESLPSKHKQRVNFDSHLQSMLGDRRKKHESKQKLEWKKKHQEAKGIIKEFKQKKKEERGKKKTEKLEKKEHRTKLKQTPDDYRHEFGKCPPGWRADKKKERCEQKAVKRAASLKQWLNFKSHI